MSIPQALKPSSVEDYVNAFALDMHLKSHLLRQLRIVHYAAGQELLSETLEQPCLFLLVSGSVLVSRYLTDGKLAVLALLSPLALIGDVELFDYPNVQSNVVALSECVCLRLEKADVIRFGYSDPDFLRFIIQHLTRKLIQSSYIQTTSVQPLRKRIASYLLQQAGSPVKAIQLPSKSHLAALFGTTHRHLNRVLNQLQSAGLFQIQNDCVSEINVHGLQLLITS
ncbi:MAG: Crp/Fnr family transcriptional regulator [Chloroflexota bacterium]|nr:Crp/Fnr family transcriptional regulator [Chloroflexota bacterium]